MHPSLFPSLPRPLNYVPPCSRDEELGKVQRETRRQTDDQINGKGREVGRGVRGMSRQADPLPVYDKDERESL